MSSGRRPPPVPVGPLQPGDPQARHLNYPPVQVAPQRIVALGPRRVVVSPHEQQRHLVAGRQRVQVLGRQVAAAEEEIYGAQRGHRAVIEELRVLFVADGQEPASRYSNSLNNGVTSRWKTGRSTSG